MPLPLVDLLNPDQRAALKHLRKKIANREHMRRYRAEHRGKMLCGGVDLPIEAGTCGRWVSRGRDGCYACYQRRRWLLDHALNPAEITVSALLEGAAGSAAEAGADPHEDATPPEDTGRAVPLIEDLTALGDPCLRW